MHISQVSQSSFLNSKATLPFSKADDNKQLSNESLFECFSSNAGVALKVQYVSEAIFDFVKY